MDIFWQNSVVLVRSTDPGEQSFGTGFVIHKDEQASYIVTCAHVVRAPGPGARRAASQRAVAGPGRRDSR